MIILIVLGFVGLVAAVGAASKEARKPLRKRGVMVNGAATLAQGARSVWRTPGVVVDRAAVSYLVCLVAVLAVVFTFRPDLLLPAAAAVVVFLCVGAVVWDQRLTGGRPWREVWDELFRADTARRAVVATNPDAKVGAVKVRGGRVEMAVEHVGAVDHERVGQALHAPHVELVPGSQMGRSTVVVHDAQPTSALPTWDAIEARGPRVWPGTQNPTGTVRFGEDAHGNVHVLPTLVDPEKASNVFLAGMTGAGKSNGMALMLCELAWQSNVAWVGLDPHRVELKPFAPRMSKVAKGPEQCYETLDWLVAEMDRRFDYLDENDVGEWRVGVDGPGILWVVDELAALEPKRSWPQLKRLTAEQRKVGFGTIGATQRPSSKVIELDTRDNYQIRIAFGMNSREGTVMVLDHDEDKTLRPTDIPEDLQGAYILRLRRSRLAGRCYIPTATGGLSKADVQETVRLVAGATAHLRVDLKGA